MVFGLFSKSKSKDTELAPPEASQSHLQTPSPAASVGTAPPQSPDIDGDAEVLGRRQERRRSTSPSSTLAGNLGVNAPTLPPPATIAELSSRVKKIPPKTLQVYVLNQLPQVSEPSDASNIILAFFSTLVPPPKLHCVRCHKDYVEVENTDRSCLIPHDDESAEVEFAGGKGASKYETHYGCCNQTVEGEGELGPPNGWCFEGFHTMDLKRARFRADSTIEDDRLVSCKRKKCFNSASGSGLAESRGRRAAARKSLREASSEEDEDFDDQEVAKEAKELVEGSDAGTSVSAKKTSKGKPKKRKNEAEVVERDDAEDMNKKLVGTPSSILEPESISSAPSKSKAKGKATSMRPKSTPKSVKLNSPPSGLLPQGNAMDVDTVQDPDVNATSAVTSTPSVRNQAQKPRKKPRKSTDGGKYRPPKDEDDGSSEFEEDGQDDRKRKKPRRKSLAAVDVA